MASYTRKQLEAWIKDKKVSGNVLDIGGSQLPIKDRVQYDKDTNFRILDLKNPHEEKAKPEIICDLNNHFVVSGKDVDSFDYAVCLEVSEYWWNPVQALTNIWQYLKPGGTLLISFHFIYPVHRPIDEDCLRYTRPGVRKLLEKTGFKIKDIVSRKSQYNITSFLKEEGMRPAQGYDFHGDVGVLVEAIKI